MNHDVFLPFSEFNLRAKKLWNLVLNSYEDDSADFEDWTHNKFPFDSLFQNKAYTEKYLPTIKRSYDVWFNLNWKPLVELYSSQIVERYYKIIADAGKEHHKGYITSSIILEIVYSDIPNDWIWHHDNRLVLSCKSDIINRAEIVEQLKKMCLGIDSAASFF